MAWLRAGVWPLSISSGSMRSRSRTTPLSHGAFADGIDHHVGVLRQAGRVIVHRQVHHHHIVATRAEPPLHQVPVPADIAGAVDRT